MTSEEEIEAEAQHKVTALDRLQMVSKLFRELNLVESIKFFKCAILQYYSQFDSLSFL